MSIFRRKKSSKGGEDDVKLAQENNVSMEHSVLALLKVRRSLKRDMIAYIYY